MKYFVIIFFLVAGLSVKAQVKNSFQCDELFRQEVDTFFVSHLGQNKYDEIKETIGIVFELKVDSLGNILTCDIVKSINITDSIKEFLCLYLQTKKLACLYDFYHPIKPFEPFVSIYLPINSKLFRKR